VTVIGLAGPDAEPLGVQVTVKLVTGEAPLGPGKNWIVAWPLPGVPVPMVGAPGVPGSMVMLKFCETLPLALVALTVPVEEPAVVGVPESTPVVELSVRPGGKLPAERLKVGAGEPLGVLVCL
jgi:hypothetical protein